MSDLSSEIPKDWYSVLSRFQTEIRTGWFWDAFQGWFVTAITLGAILSWTLRSGEVSIIPGVLCGGGLLLVGGIHALQSLRRQPSSLTHCLSRLDDGWGMGQRLMRAFSTGEPWPPLPHPQPRLPVQVKTSVWGWPVLFVLLCTGLAVWVPPMIRPPMVVTPKAPPPAWAEIGKALDALAEEVVEPDSLSELEEALNDLQGTPEEEWFTQSGLEATDRLRDQMRSQVQEFRDGLNEMADLLEQSRAAQLGQIPQEGLDQEFNELMKQLNDQSLQLSEEQLQQLRMMDMSQLQQLDPQTMENLEAKLREACNAMEGELAALGILMMPAGGAPDGGGHEDLGLRDQSSLGWGQMPVLLEMNPEAALEMGDQLEVREVEHEEAVEFLQRRAGAVASDGDGGAAVWRQELVPREQRVLKQFFDSNPSSDRPSSRQP